MTEQQQAGGSWRGTQRARRSVSASSVVASDAAHDGMPGAAASTTSLREPYSSSRRDANDGGGGGASSAGDQGRGTSAGQQKGARTEDDGDHVESPNIDLGMMADAFDRMVLEFYPLMRLYSFVSHILSWENPRLTLAAFAVSLLCSFLPLLIPLLVAMLLTALLWHRFAMRDSVKGILFKANIVKAVDSYTSTIPRAANRDEQMRLKLARFHNMLLMMQSFILATTRFLVAVRGLLFWREPTTTLWFIANVIGVCLALVLLPQEYVSAFVVVSVFAAQTHLGKACRAFYVPTLPAVDLAAEVSEMRPLAEREEDTLQEVKHQLGKMREQLDNTPAPTDLEGEEGRAAADATNDTKERGDDASISSSVSRTTVTTLRGNRTAPATLDADGGNDGGNPASAGAHDDDGVGGDVGWRGEDDAMAPLGSMLQTPPATNAATEYEEGGYVWVDVDKALTPRQGLTHSASAAPRTPHAGPSRSMSTTSGLRHRPNTSTSHRNKRGAHACSHCRAAFGIMRHKYDCNCCGSPICSRCCVKVKKSLFGAVGTTATARVCVPCAETLRARAEGVTPNEREIVLSTDALS